MGKHTMDPSDAPATLSDRRERLLPSFSLLKQILWPDIVPLHGLSCSVAKPRPMGPASAKHIPRQ